MSVESARFTETGQIYVVIDGMECSFPDDVTEQHIRDPETDELTGEVKLVSSNAQRQMVLDWQAEGNSIAPYTPPEPVAPDRVSSRQFFMMLDKLDETTNPGIYEQVNAWVALQPRAIRLVYEKAGSFVRTDEMLQQGFVALGFTPEQIDAFFTAAVAL